MAAVGFQLKMERERKRDKMEWNGRHSVQLQTTPDDVCLSVYLSIYRIDQERTGRPYTLSTVTRHVDGQLKDVLVYWSVFK